jgi:peptidoglycan hydrolase CwlO-like protein
MERPTLLTEKTWIPLGASVVIFGAAMWLTTVYAQGLENQKALIDLKAQRKDDIEYIRQELHEIKEDLKEINKKIK